MKLREQHWYRLDSKQCEEAFKQDYYGVNLYNLLMVHKYFKVNTVDLDNGDILDIEFPDGSVYPGSIDAVVLKQEHFQYFKEIEYLWAKNASYVLVNPTGLANASTINKRFISIVGSSPFTVKEIDVPDSRQSLRTRTRVISVCGTEFNFALTQSELRFFAKIDKITGAISEDYCSKLCLSEPKASNIITISGPARIEVVVDDEASRLFAIKALEGVRFASV